MNPLSVLYPTHPLARQKVRYHQVSGLQEILRFSYQMSILLSVELLSWLQLPQSQAREAYLQR